MLLQIILLLLSRDAQPHLPPQAYREIRTHTRRAGGRVRAQPTARGKGRELPWVPAGERGPGGVPEGRGGAYLYWAAAPLWVNPK